MRAIGGGLEGALVVVEPPVQAGDGEYRKSTMAFTSAENASGGMEFPAWCCSGTCSIAPRLDPSRACRNLPSSAAEAQPSKQFAW